MRRALTLKDLGELGSRLKSLRENFGKSQSDVAELLGVSQGVLSEYENGKSEPGSTVIGAAAIGFNISADDLLIEDDEIDENDLSASDRALLENCRGSLINLSRMLTGASRSPIKVFADHLRELEFMVSNVHGKPRKLLSAKAAAEKLTRKKRGPDLGGETIAAEGKA